MTDSPHGLFHDDHVRDRGTPSNVASVGWGASLAAVLIVAAIALAALKLSAFDTPDMPSLIPMDQPAVHSNFTA
nr:hypothetical protein [uncultured Dongia sp.]